MHNVICPYCKKSKVSNTQTILTKSGSKDTFKCLNKKCEEEFSITK